MSNDGARAAFVEAFFEVVAPKVKQVSVAIEVQQECCRRILLALFARSIVSVDVAL